jgi:hypothetical protein
MWACQGCDFRGDVSPYSIPGRSPLLTALEKGNGGSEITKILLKQKPYLKLHGGEQKLAMKGGDDKELLIMLLEADSANRDGWKDFLQEAVSQRRLVSTKLLLSMDADGRGVIDSVTILRAGLLTGDYYEACKEIAVCDYDSWSLLEAVKWSSRSPSKTRRSTLKIIFYVL